MRLLDLPKLGYPLTKPFKWPWFTGITYTIGFIVFIVFTAINVVLVGYEPVTVFHPDWNLTEHYWYDTWLPSSKPTCDPLVLNPGDSFSTNYSIFQWMYKSRAHDDENDGGVAYSGTVLDECDLRFIVINGDLRTFTLDVNAIMACDANSDFDVTAQASYTFQHLGLVGVTEPNNTLSGFLQVIAQAANDDFSKRLQNFDRATNDQAPISLSLRYESQWCPAEQSWNATCATRTPLLTVNSSALAFPNGTSRWQIHVDDNVFPDEITLPLYNVAQVVQAMVRIDLGNQRPNNFFVNQSALAVALHSTFPSTSLVPAMNSSLCTILAHPEEVGAKDVLPFPTGGPAHLRAFYACRMQKRKALGAAVVSVIVATLSMFTAGWGGFMLIATMIAKWKSKNANRCEGHEILDESPLPSKEPQPV